MVMVMVMMMMIEIIQKNPRLAMAPNMTPEPCEVVEKVPSLEHCWATNTRQIPMWTFD